MRGGRDGPGGSGGNVRHGSLAVREQARARHKAAREESEKCDVLRTKRPNEYSGVSNSDMRFTFAATLE